MVYVHNVQNMKNWLEVESTYGSDKILMFAGTYDVPPQKEKDNKEPLQEATDQGTTTGTE